MCITTDLSLAILSVRFIKFDPLLLLAPGVKGFLEYPPLALRGGGGANDDSTAAFLTINYILFTKLYRHVVYLALVLLLAEL